MFKKLIQQPLRKHYGVRDKPRGLELKSFIKIPLRYLVFIILISALTNTMPFYSNGERMNIIQGIGTVLLQKQGSFTIPYVKPENGEAYTEIDPIGPDNKYYIDEKTFFGIPYNIGNFLKVDLYTASVLFLMIIMTLFSFLLTLYEIPFYIAEKFFYKAAFKPKNTNQALKGIYGIQIVQASIICFLSTFIVIFIFLNLATSEGGEGTTKILGIYFNPKMLIIAALFCWFWVKYIFQAKRLLNNLISRRCTSCFHMDTIKVIDTEYVRTDKVTKTWYKKHSNGSKKQVSQNSWNEEIYDVTYECQNCGFSFKRRESR